MTGDTGNEEHFKGTEEDDGKWRQGGRASSNLEHGGDVRVRPESRLREMETLVETQWMNNKNGDLRTTRTSSIMHAEEEKITSANMHPNRHAA